MTTIYRAADTADCFPGSHWTSCAMEADEYTRNPGFGGPQVFTASVEGRVLRADDIKELAEELLSAGFEFDGDARELADYWLGCGHDQVFHVLENVRGVLSAIKAAGFDWIRFDEPSIRCNYSLSTTFRRI